MKIVVVGGTGTIGAAVVAALREEHEVIAAGHTGGDRQVDIASPESIRALFEEVGEVGAVICCAGRAAFGSIDSLSEEEWELSMRNKLRGQIDVVRIGHAHVADGGSLTLTSGVLSQEPIPGSAAISTANAGLEGFVRAAALEMPRGIRVNVVSPPWVSETLTAMGRDPSGGIPAAAVARAYLEALTGTANGEVLDARRFA